jgi:gamma-glutamylcyclotransferase (GGCT)/AIG2-like uncharacterized protein YtfP
MLDAPRKADGKITDQYRMISLGGFPGLLKEGTPTEITVEVYEVTSDRIAGSLDMLEGYPSFYDRELTTLVDGRECWVYFLGDRYNSYPVIDSGDWCNRS